MADRVNLVAALQELAGLERDFARVYAIAALRSQRHELAPETKAGLHRMRDDLHSFQMALFQAMTPSALWSIPAISSRIPQPRRWPDLPSPGQPMPQGFDVSGAGVRGLGNPVVIVAGGITITIAPLLLFGIVALIIIGGVASIAYSVYVAGETVRRIIATREITKRYEAQVAATERRYNECRASGQSVEACNNVAPLPQPPTDDAAPSTPGWMWAVGGVAGVAVLFGVVYAYSRGASIPRRTAAMALSAGSV